MSVWPILIVALAVAACDGGSTDRSAPSSETSTATSTATTSPDSTTEAPTTTEEAASSNPTTAPLVDVGEADEAEVSAALAELAASDTEPIGSTGSNLLDLITDDDPSVFVCLVDHGRGEAEFYDKRTDQLSFHDDGFLYTARYADGIDIAIRVHPEFETAENARAQVDLITTRLGRLPTMLRSGIIRVGILDGDETAQADGGGEGIHLHAGNAALRVSNDRLEETLFHESIHTSLDDLYADDPGWIAAQEADGAFLTTYARNYPATEDLAETALYAYALLRHPERVPDLDRAVWRALVPNRIDYLSTIFPPDADLFDEVDDSITCD